MQDWLLTLASIAAYWGLTLWLLPRFGAPACRMRLRRTPCRAAYPHDTRPDDTRPDDTRAA